MAVAIVTGRGGRRAGAGRPRLGERAMVRVAVTLDPRLLAAVDAYVAERGTSRSAAVRTALLRLVWRHVRAGKVASDRRLV